MSDEREPRHDEERKAFREEADSLWRLTLGPVVWAGHFLIVYAAAAVACEKLGEMVPWLHWSLIALSVVAAAAIAWLGWRSFRQWDVRHTGDFSNPEGEAEDRHQFLGHAGFLLAAISLIGVIYVTMPLIFTGTCR